MKEQTITFKVDQMLYEQLANIPNKSEFIRESIFKALNNVCPLCNGTGILNSCQQKHWNEFSDHHQLSRCDDCHSVYLTCQN